MKILAVALLPACLLLGQGVATRGVKPQPRGKPSGKPFHAKFTNVAAQAGLRAPAIYGGLEKVNYIVENSAGGVALFDYDNDGLIDIFILSGTRFEGAPAGATNRLYRNLGELKFEDVTEKARLHRSGWANSVAIGDFDNDGWMDLFITYWGGNALYRNRGDGTFEDVTKHAGLLLPGPKGKPVWSSGATFIDYDRDGRLDLFIANYIDFDLENTPKPGENPNCNWKGVPVACGPRGLKTARHWLFRNLGEGRFEDVSNKSGIAALTASFGMTAVATDFDGDGWPDIYVACDSTPSLFFRNQRDGAFAEEGIERGVALNEDGMEQAGMGLGIGDYNLDGRLDILKTHFADDTHILYRNDGGGQFSDVTLAAGLGVETRFTGWGAGIHDFDNDGLPDLFIATGNVYPETERELPAYPYRTPPLLFRNLDGARFEQLMDAAGPALVEPLPARGAAFADLDNDGDLDIVIWNRNEPPALLRNDLTSPEPRGWLQVELKGTQSNRAAIGAQVVVEYGGRRQAQAVLSQASFYSANPPRLHFGLGGAPIQGLTVLWPSGRRERFAVPGINRIVVLVEGQGRTEPEPAAANPPR